ncbi:hypothetical protein A4G99_16655 [Haladaptatus sp. R4]|uniref:ThuA domain-containing protein n=1 Tax=Haladaptatus sp. R4 TaxID=1679489 RepID=UPI0007B4E0FD|nr:ThuA domain-containing protein [Haladaptatus sp. R4]KZN23125.1 hypothetical protein A4G99_16655 [Haladaptatus sp. R4]
MKRQSIHAAVWSEGTTPLDVYPNDVNTTIAEHLNENRDIVAKAISINDDEQGVSNDLLDWCDVILWWGHLRHDDVSEKTVNRVEQCVREKGAGYIGLHSGHYAKPYKRLIGTSGDLGAVRNEQEKEEIEVVSPSHPIATGIDDFSLPKVEMFGEPYDIPEPDQVIFESSFEDGGEFRSGVTFTFGAGRGFYFRPGHEEFRIYHDPTIQQILTNATRWAANRSD